MRVVPELVFVNCCHLAARSAAEVLGRPPDRALFAAGVAEKLIAVGVRCVIAAGWAVDDHAANAFATTFYGALLKGQRFIDAVARAREAALARRWQHLGGVSVLRRPGLAVPRRWARWVWRAASSHVADGRIRGRRFALDPQDCARDARREKPVPGSRAGGTAPQTAVFGKPLRRHLGRHRGSCRGVWIGMGGVGPSAERDSLVSSGARRRKWKRIVAGRGAIEQHAGSRRG